MSADQAIYLKYLIPTAEVPLGSLLGSFMFVNRMLLGVLNGETVVNGLDLLKEGPRFSVALLYSTLGCTWPVTWTLHHYRVVLECSCRFPTSCCPNIKLGIHMPVAHNKCVPHWEWTVSSCKQGTKCRLY
jgi:hypothetical protein